MLNLVKTSNHFGQHDFIIDEICDKTQLMERLANIRWHKQPSIVDRGDTIEIHCFTNYDKVKLEGEFANG